jgi:hypothetical protein
MAAGGDDTDQGYKISRYTLHSMTHEDSMPGWARIPRFQARHAGATIVHA